MSFYRRTLRISQTEHMTNKEVLSITGTKRTFVSRIRKVHLGFHEHNEIRRHGKVGQRKTSNNLTLETW